MDIDMSALRLLEREREIPLDLLIPDHRAGPAGGLPQDAGHLEKARAELDRKSGHVTIWATEIDDDGAPVGEFEDTPAGFGRIAASTARQIILQRLQGRWTTTFWASSRAARATGGQHHPAGQQPAHDPGQPGHGGGTAAAAEQVPGEKYTHGNRLRAFVIDVHRGTKGPSITLSGPIRASCGSSSNGSSGNCGPLRGNRCPGPRGRPPHQDGRQGQQPRHQRRGYYIGEMGSRVRAVMNELNEREDGHCRLQRRSGDVHRQRALPVAGEFGHHHGRGDPVGSAWWSRTTSSRSPSARRARMPASPPSSPAGGSTSSPTPRSPATISSNETALTTADPTSGSRLRSRPPASGFPQVRGPGA